MNIDNNGDGFPEGVYEFRFTTRVSNAKTFLYNTGPIGSLTDPNWNVRQTYSVSKVMINPGRRRDDDDREKSRTVLGDGLISPPVRIGPRSTPGYDALANAAASRLPAHEK